VPPPGFILLLGNLRLDQAGEDRLKNGRYKEAASMFRALIEARKFPEFLALSACDWLVAHE
jgi:hypothetical protein